MRSFEEVEASDRGKDYYVAGIRERLEAAVDNELISDVPICTILSGGVDSTIITYLLSKRVTGLRAFTVTVGGTNGRDDLHYARMAAEAIGVPLTEVSISSNEVAHDLCDAVWAVEDDRWVQVAPAIPQIALAKVIGGAGYKVVFGGEGSDELFASYADSRMWSWEPAQYHAERLSLCRGLHNNNLIRGNKAMMQGTVELRAPFVDRELVDFCLNIPTCYRDDAEGRGRVMKPLLRAAFRGDLPDELLMRKKVTFQEGAHTDFLRDSQELIRDVFRRLFGNGEVFP